MAGIPDKQGYKIDIFQVVTKNKAFFNIFYTLLYGFL